MSGESESMSPLQREPTFISVVSQKDMTDKSLTMFEARQSSGTTVD
jgi:hypothetical protein